MSLGERVKGQSHTWEVVKNEYLAEASLTDGERSMLLFSAREELRD